MAISMSSALIPYTPQTSMEFIRSEVERCLKNRAIVVEQLLPPPSTPPRFGASQQIDLYSRVVQDLFDSYYND